jgi:hypothetical protein
MLLSGSNKKQVLLLLYTYICKLELFVAVMFYTSRGFPVINTHTVLILNIYIDIFNLPNPSSRTTALGSTQPLKEMITRNLPGCKGGPAREADNLTAIYESIV